MKKFAKSNFKTPIWDYHVVGRSYFPMDMLRYDRCWPIGPVSVINLAKLPTEFLKEERHRFFSELRIVQMNGIREPSVERWESFGWHVFPSRKEADDYVQKNDPSKPNPGKSCLMCEQGKHDECQGGTCECAVLTHRISFHEQSPVIAWEVEADGME